MLDTYENYIGKVIENERTRRGLSVNDVCSGICSKSVYVKLESGEYAGGMHVLRAICQRLGINSGRCGTYLVQNDYDEMMDRLYILEDIKDGRIDTAELKIVRYGSRYKDMPLNNQFILFMKGRIAELRGRTGDAQGFYDAAICITMPEYMQMKKLVCMTIYEAYMLLDIAHLNVVLGKKKAAYGIYALLLRYCEKSNVEKWNLVCIYPKTVCGIIDDIGLDNMDAMEKNEMLRHCISALDTLRKTARLHYIRPLLKNIIRLNEGVSQSHYDSENYSVLLEGIDVLFKSNGHERELFEWYPYYVDCEFRCVNKLIDERRRMHGMSVEELAGTTQSVRNVQRIIKGQVSPSYNTSRELLDKLGLKGALRSDVIVADDIEAYELWDELVCGSLKGNYEEKRKIIYKLKTILDTSIELNKMALEYEMLLCKINIENMDYRDALKCADLLPFSIEDIGRYHCMLPIELMIINKYFWCADKLKNYEQLDRYEQMLSDYTKNKLLKRLFAKEYEVVCFYCSSFYGNMGEYGKSNELSVNGIADEIECERAYAMTSFLYNILWNNSEAGTVTQGDIKMCRTAYQICNFYGYTLRAEKLKKWLDKNA